MKKFFKFGCLGVIAIIAIVIIALIIDISNDDEQPTEKAKQEEKVQYEIVIDEKFKKTEQRQIRATTGSNDEADFETITKEIMNKYKNQNLDSMHLYIHAPDGKSFGQLKAHSFIAYTQKGAAQTGLEKADTFKIEVEKNSTETTSKNTENIQKKEPSTKVSSDSNKVYINSIRPEIDEITAEYDRIWNDHWQAVWGNMSNATNSSDIASLKDDMNIVYEKYSELSKRISAIDSKSVPSDLQERLETYRVEMSLATNYRGNAATAIIQAIDGVADLNSRMEEATKSVELSDKKMLSAIVAITSIDQELGLLKQ